MSIFRVTSYHPTSQGMGPNPTSSNRSSLKGTFHSLQKSHPPLKTSNNRSIMNSPVAGSNSGSDEQARLTEFQLILKQRKINDLLVFYSPYQKKFHSKIRMKLISCATKQTHQITSLIPSMSLSEI